MTDEVKRRLLETKWHYAEQDPRARQELMDRIAEVARRKELINYSDLVRGISFRIPTVKAGVPFEIDTSDWSDLDRAIIGDFLGRINLDSYEQAGIFVSAIVVNQAEGTSGKGFTNFMRDLGALRATGEMAAFEFWAQEVKKVYQWYQQPGH